MAWPRDAVGSAQQFPAFYKPLSLKLYSALEGLGSSTEISTLTKERGLVNGVLSTLFHRPKLSYCVFGSFVEGTLVPGDSGLASDIDNVFIVNDLPVITNCTDAPVLGKCLLLVQDQSTPPGYCKLQLVQNGKPLFVNDPTEVISSFMPGQETWKACADKSNRIVLSFSPPDNSRFDLKRHGPALSAERHQSVAACDWVFAF